MQRLIIVSLFCCLSTGLFAQNALLWSIIGKVTDEATGDPIEFAGVVLHSVRNAAVTAHGSTGSDGSYSLSCSKAGEYYLEVVFVGYESYKSEAFRLTETQKDLTYDVVLHPTGLKLEEVEIMGKKRQIIYKLDKKVIETAGNIAAAGGTAVDILAQTPSVRVDADGEVTFRGSSGFKVYIDGKPSTLEGSAALEQIPAEHIENIEIITTPSARNEADGIAGIINIVTKKQIRNGWSGMLSAKGNTLGARGVNFLTSYRKNQIRWQTLGEASRTYRISDFDQYKEIHTDTVTTTHSFGERKSYTDAYFLRSGIEWDKGNTTWSTSIEGRYGIRNRGGSLRYEDSYASGNTTTWKNYSGSDYVRLDEWSAYGNLGFEHRFPQKGRRLSGSFFGLYQGDAMEFFYTDLFNDNGSRAQGHRAEEFEYRFTAQGNLDYVHPFNEKEGKFEAGYYFFTYTEDGDYNIWFWDEHQPDATSKFGNGFVWKSDLYNRFIFRRDIHALYAMLSDTYGKFSYQAGLRSEYRYRKLGNSEEWARHVWHDFDLFPSIHTAYHLSRGGRLNLSYSRRVTQPQLFYMEPYVVYVDYYTAQRGNPKILPEYTDSYEFTCSKGFGNHSASGTLFHRKRKDKIERVRVPYHTGVTLDSMANVGNDYSSGAESAASFQINKWWSMDINGSLFYYRIENEYKINDEDEESLNWQLAVNQNVDIGKNTRLRFEGYYLGPSVSTQGRVNDFFYFNFSVRQQFFNKKMTATLNFRDVFSTAQYVGSQRTRNLYSNTTIHPAWPSVRLSIAYAFNNFKSKTDEEKASHDLFEGTNR
ncbi:MAG: TonB-dependent receptor [Bacteroidales bacterium]|nr:TonB-dependent receptor [Bacteroidales bacterium]